MVPFVSTSFIYWNTVDLVFQWHWNYLLERTSCNLENDKNSQEGHYIVSIWYVTALKCCVVVDSQVKIWSCMLSFKNSSNTFMPSTSFWYHLTIFAKFKYDFDFDKLAKTLEPSRNDELCHFPSILIEKFNLLQLLWCEKSQSSLRVFFIFFVLKFDLLLIYLTERNVSATYNKSQTNWVVFVDFVLKC